MMGIPFEGQGIWQEMPAEFKGRLLVALLEYSENGTEPGFDGCERVIFLMMKKMMEEAEAREEEAAAFAAERAAEEEEERLAYVERQRANGKKGGRPRKVVEEKGEESEPFSEKRVGFSEKRVGFLEKGSVFEEKGGFSAVSEKKEPKKSMINNNNNNSDSNVSKLQRECIALVDDDYDDESVSSSVSSLDIKSYGSSFMTDEEYIGLQEKANDVYEMLDKVNLGTPRNREKIDALIADYSAEWVLQALDCMSDAAPQKWGIAYVRKCLENWRAAGGITRDKLKGGAGPRSGTFGKSDNPFMDLLKEVEAVDTGGND